MLYAELTESGLLTKSEGNRLSQWPKMFLMVAVSLIVAGAQAQLPVPAPSGMISWWPGDSNGADIYSTNDGTLYGGATAGNPGVDGGAFVFDGTNGYFAVPDAPSLDPANLTIESWVRCDNLNAAANGGYPGQQYIIFHQNAEMYNFEGFDLAKDRRPVDIATNDTWCFEVTSVEGDNVFVESVTHVQTNVWYHLAGVRGSNYIQLYVNGVLEGETNVNFPQSYGPFPLYFADTGESYYDPKFAGALDEVALYDRPLSPNEIYAIYAAGHAGKAKEPIALNLTMNASNQSPQVLVAGIPGQAYGIQTASSPGATNAWTGVTNLTLAATTNVWIDSAQGTNAEKYYRVLPGTIPVP